MFTDTHCHIYCEDYNIDDILKNAQTNHINKMINNGCDKKTNLEVLEISRKYKNIYPAIGYHPQNLANFKFADLKLIEDNINNIVAIGEIGLDYYNGISDRELQKEVLRKQLNLAQQYQKPVIIHSRDATEDTIKILKEFPNVKGSIHCFSGSFETAQKYIKMGYKLGFNGVVTFKNSKLFEVVEKLPLDSIILETDSPYLTPEPYRGHKNEPAYIYNIALRICEIKKISMQDLSEITEKNVRDLF